MLKEIKQLTATELQEQILMNAIEIRNSITYKNNLIKYLTIVLIADIIVSSISILNV